MSFYGYTITHVKDHVEVSMNGKFLFTADTVKEAKSDILEILG